MLTFFQVWQCHWDLALAVPAVPEEKEEKDEEEKATLIKSRDPHRARENKVLFFSHEIGQKFGDAPR